MVGTPYLSKYPNLIYNASIHPVYCSLFMSKFFGSVNEVDFHNKSSQSNLSLEKFWVTQCGWIRLYTTVTMVIDNPTMNSSFNSISITSEI